MGRRRALWRISKQRVFLADILQILICIPLAMTLAVAAIGLIRFSLTREGAIFWLIVSIIIFFKMRHRIFRH